MRIPKQSKILSNAGNGFGAIQRAYTKTLEEDRMYYIVVRSYINNTYTKNLKYKNSAENQKKKIDIKKSAHCTDFFISSYRR